MGAITLDYTKPTKITIQIKDAFGNTRTLNFWALRDAASLDNYASAPYQFLLPFDAESHIDLDELSMEVPKSALYETVQLQYLLSGIVVAIFTRLCITCMMKNTRA